MESYRELLAQRAALETRIQDARARELPAVIADIQRDVVEFRLTALDLWPKRKRRTRAEMAAAREGQSGG